MTRYVVAFLVLAVLIALTLSGDHYRARFAEIKQAHELRRN